MTSRTAPFVLAALGVVAVALPSAPAPAASTPTVRMPGVAFTPQTVRIAVGGTVRFRWSDNGILHDVTPVGARRFSFTVKGKTRRTASARFAGTVTTRPFRRAGTYRYVCTIHVDGGMTGRIVVR